MYFAKALALQVADRDNAQFYYDKSIECLISCNGKLANNKLTKNYFNIGFHYYFEKEYDKALIYYKKYLESNLFFTLHVIYILHCTEILETDELDLIFSSIELNSENTNDISKVFYKYFVMKINKVSEKRIEDYIMQDICKILVYDYKSDYLIKYFEYELAKLIKVTKCYKDLSEFKRITSHKID